MIYAAVNILWEALALSIPAVVMTVIVVLMVVTVIGYDATVYFLRGGTRDGDAIIDENIDTEMMMFDGHDNDWSTILVHPQGGTRALHLCGCDHGDENSNLIIGMVVLMLMGTLI